MSDLLPCTEVLPHRLRSLSSLSPGAQAYQLGGSENVSQSVERPCDYGAPL